MLNVPQTSEGPWSLIHHRDVKLKGSEYGSMRENGEDMFEAVENKHANKHVEIEGISFEEDKVVMVCQHMVGWKHGILLIYICVCVRMYVFICIEWKSR